MFSIQGTSALKIQVMDSHFLYLCKHMLQVLSVSISIFSGGIQKRGTPASLEEVRLLRQFSIFIVISRNPFSQTAHKLIGKSAAYAA